MESKWQYRCQVGHSSRNSEPTHHCKRRTMGESQSWYLYEFDNIGSTELWYAMYKHVVCISAESADLISKCNASTVQKHASCVLKHLNMKSSQTMVHALPISPLQNMYTHWTQIYNLQLTVSSNKRHGSIHREDCKKHPEKVWSYQRGSIDLLDWWTIGQQYTGARAVTSRAAPWGKKDEVEITHVLFKQ